MRVALLIALKGLERALGRRPRGHWGPREVDLDLLVFGRHAIEVDRPAGGRSADPDKAALPLTVPHREARHRLFVLAPLSDLVPGLTPPGWGETVATAAARQRSVEGADAGRRSPNGTASGGAARLTVEPRRSRSGLQSYSRTAGGRSRSNMWTVSTNRTCLVW